MVSLRDLKDLTNSEGEGRSDAERRLNVKGNVPVAVCEVRAHESAAVDVGCGDDDGGGKGKGKNAAEAQLDFIVLVVSVPRGIASVMCSTLILDNPIIPAVVTWMLSRRGLLSPFSTEGLHRHFSFSACGCERRKAGRQMETGRNIELVMKFASTSIYVCMYRYI